MMLRSLSQRLSGSTSGRSVYDILPTTSDRHGHGGQSAGFRRWDNQPWYTRLFTKPILRLFVLAVICIGTVHLFWSADLLVAVAEVDLNRKPPLYEKYHQEELRLPQHNPDLPYPEGRHGKYIWYANHVHCTYASSPRVGSGHSWMTQHRGGGTPCRSTF